MYKKGWSVWRIGAFITPLFFSLVQMSCPAQQTAFTYQGRLNSNQSGANGLYDLRFGLYTNSLSGTSLSTVTNTAVLVTDGLFVVSLDYGNLLSGPSYWLEIGVRSNGTQAGFVTLAPRQPVTPAPFAMYALYGTITTNVFIGNGAGLTNLAATNILGLGSMAFQQTNSPTMYNATNYGEMEFPQTNGLGGAWFADYAVISLGGSQVKPYMTMRSNPAHGPGDEIETVVSRRFALVAGVTGNFDDAIQIGYAGIFGNSAQGPACPLYFQHDNLGDHSGTNDLGYSMLVYWVADYSGGLQVEMGLRGEAVDTNGNGALVFYNVLNPNALIGQSPGNKMGLEIWTTGLVTHGRMTKDVTTSIPTGTNFGVTWEGNQEYVLNITSDLNLTNIPPTWGRTNQSDNVTLWIVPGATSRALNTPATWVWGGENTNVVALTRIPASTKIKLDIEREIDSGITNYYAQAKYFHYTP